MLYQRWIETVARHRDRVALIDSGRGRTWTFSQLADAAEAGAIPPVCTIMFPSGGSIDFILAVLRGWRAGAVVCPLEPGCSTPDIPSVPPSVRHLKITSGTSGIAKCVAFTEMQLAADAEAIVKTMGLTPDSPNLGCISLAHSYGFSSLVTPLLLHGIPLWLSSSPLPAALGEAARSAPGVLLTLPAVPTMWRAWHEAGAIPPNIRLAISAGAALPIGLEQAVFSSGGLKIHNFLGASECGGIAYDPTLTPRTDPSFAGYPLAGVTVNRGGDGCLEVTSPSVGLSYWPDKDESLRDGVYRSRDSVEFDPNGGLLLRGRSDDLINVAGRKVFPDAIETVLRKHPSVKECLVVGVPSAEYRAESIVAIIELASPEAAAYVRTFAAEQLPGWQVPRAWHFVDRLSPDGRGKLSRAEWRRRITC